MSRLSLIVAANVSIQEESNSFQRTVAASAAETASSLNISNFQILSIKMEPK